MRIIDNKEIIKKIFKEREEEWFQLLGFRPVYKKEDELTFEELLEYLAIALPNEYVIEPQSARKIHIYDTAEKTKGVSVTCPENAQLLSSSVVKASEIIVKAFNRSRNDYLSHTI